VKHTRKWGRYIIHLGVKERTIDKRIFHLLQRDVYGSVEGLLFLLGDALFDLVLHRCNIFLNFLDELLWNNEFIKKQIPVGKDILWLLLFLWSQKLDWLEWRWADCFLELHLPYKGRSHSPTFGGVSLLG
jgi:hypothetical protein